MSNLELRQLVEKDGVPIADVIPLPEQASGSNS